MIKIKKILFRADSSSTIGTGHIMRDLVLAAQFNDAEIVFATQDLPGNINHKIAEKNYRIELLKSNHLEELIEIIKKYNINMIVIDHYGIDYEYEKVLKEKTGIKIFVLDDTYKKHHCDILLNHNISADPQRYKELLSNSCEIRCGRNYTLLRKEFYEAKKTINRTKLKNGTQRILVVMGGADHARKNIDILSVLQEYNNINIIVVTTTANQHLDELKTFVQKYKNIELQINTDEIAYLMAKTDMAIVTPSVTVNEILFMETPFIAIKTADNQQEIYNYLLIKGYNVLENFDAGKLNILLKSFLR